jgi:multimeric flavodoxin WrbA
MAKILLLLTSARKNGFTAGLLKEAAGAAEKIPGVKVEILHAFDYKLGRAIVVSAAFAIRRNFAAWMMIWARMVRGNCSLN